MILSHLLFHLFIFLIPLSLDCFTCQFYEYDLKSHCSPNYLIILFYEGFGSLYFYPFFYFYCEKVYSTQIIFLFRFPNYLYLFWNLDEFFFLLLMVWGRNIYEQNTITLNVNLF